MSLFEDLVTFVESRKNPVFEIEMAGISYCDGAYKVVRKNSPIFIFEYIIAGEGTVICDGETFHPKQGDVYILKFGSNHEYFSDMQNPWTKVWLNAKGDLIQHLLRDMGLEFTTLIENFQDGSVLHEIVETAKNKELTQQQIFNKCQILLHQFILQLHDFVQKDGKETFPKEAVAMKEYIAAHVEENISIKTLANLIHLSPSRTINIFKKAYHCTPYDYLLKLKIETAALLLKNTNFSVKEIALQLGYCDTHYFSNYFKKATSFSPTEFRSKE